VVLVSSLAGCGEPTPEKYQLAVTLHRDVTPEQRLAVEQRMRATANVESVTLETGEQSFEQAKETFKDQPDILQGMTPQDMPDSLIATITDASIAEAVEIMMDTVEGVTSTVIRLTDLAADAQSTGVILELDDDVTDDQRAAIDKAVHALPAAESIEFESKEGAVKRLKERCEGKPALIAVLDPAKTYASFRFEMRLEKSPGFAELQKLDGVRYLRLVPLSTL
jgi:cell division protein FtsX